MTCKEEKTHSFRIFFSFRWAKYRAGSVWQGLFTSWETRKQIARQEVGWDNIPFKNLH